MKHTIDRRRHKQMDEEEFGSDIEDEVKDEIPGYDDEDDEDDDGFDDEAEEVSHREAMEEDDENSGEEGFHNRRGIRRHASDQSQAEGNDEDSIGIWIDKDRKVRKSIRHFSYDLLARAIRYEWDDEMIVELIYLVCRELGQKSNENDQVKKILEKCELARPLILSQLIETKSIQFTQAEIISMLLQYAGSMSAFITVMKDALDLDLFDLEYPDNIHLLCTYTQDSMTHAEYIHYIKSICEHTASKKICGKILAVATSRYDQTKAIDFIVDIITLDFFHDISGTTKECLASLPEKLRTEIDEYLKDAGYERNTETGDILDSDEDSEGNLKGFINDDEESHSTAFSSENDSQNSSDIGGRGPGKRHKETNKSKKSRGNLTNKTGSVKSSKKRSTLSDSEESTSSNGANSVDSKENDNDADSDDDELIFAKKSPKKQAKRKQLETPQSSAKKPPISADSTILDLANDQDQTNQEPPAKKSKTTDDFNRNSGKTGKKKANIIIYEEDDE